MDSIDFEQIVCFLLFSYMLWNMYASMKYTFHCHLNYCQTNLPWENSQKPSHLNRVCVSTPPSIPIYNWFHSNVRFLSCPYGNIKNESFFFFFLILVVVGKTTWWHGHHHNFTTRSRLQMWSMPRMTAGYSKRRSKRKYDNNLIDVNRL